MLLSIDYSGAIIFLSVYNDRLIIWNPGAITGFSYGSSIKKKNIVHNQGAG